MHISTDTVGKPGAPRRAGIRGLSRNVVVLGLVSLFTDMASEMLYPIMPLFVVGTLGASPAVWGFIDGLAEGISSGLRWLGGALSDRYRTRKPFVTAGYTISALSKPVMGLAAYVLGWPLFLVARCSDRLGKSIRTSARDALIADSTPAEDRGAAFGFHRAMDTTGAVLGPLVALAIVVAWPRMRALHLSWLFFLALVPGLISAALAFLAVRDITHEPKATHVAPPSILQRFPASFWQLIAANALFSLGNSSDTFLILRSNKLGLSFALVILLYATYNAFYAAAAAPLGRLSDRIGRKPVIIVGWIIYAAVYLGFAVARAPWVPWILLCAYGLYQAFTDGITKAMVSDVVPSDQRAGAIGLFYTISGLGQLSASLMAGFLWEVRWFKPQLMAPFVLGAVFALAAIPVIATVRTAPSRRAA